MERPKCAVSVVFCLAFIFTGVSGLQAEDPTEAWVARYNGPADWTDYATALAVDDSGNVYVTGWSTGSDTDRDYATIKYDSAGNQLWAERYNGPGNYDDWAYALAVDNSGNVYVTGESYDSGAAGDYATIKYDSSGSQLWVARYNGPGNAWDAAKDLVVDVLGNVYVTGDSVGSDTSHDYATIKYSIPEVITVEIDIKPRSWPNAINPRSKGVIPVAILTTSTADGENADFDATNVDPLSVRFGPGEATERHGRGHVEDVDDDGDLDMVLHFRTQGTGIEHGDTDACLAGNTMDGIDIEGCDAIVTVPRKAAPVASPEFAAFAPYPQTSNPEVWIPYRLSRGAEVSITIYNASGKLIRTLDLGFQNVGAYIDKDKAAYWNGRNEAGEQVSSGIYFYTIQAGEFTATRKIVLAR